MSIVSMAQDEDKLRKQQEALSETLLTAVSGDAAVQAYLKDKLKECAEVIGQMARCVEDSDKPRVGKRLQTSPNHDRSRDEEFLGAAIQDLGKLRLRQSSSTAYAVRVMLEHLRIVRVPSQKPGKRSGPTVEAYFLSSVDARALLESAEHIEAPVFTHCAQTCLPTSEHSGIRPIDRVLDWFLDEDKLIGYDCSECPNKAEFRDSMSIQALQQRFSKNGYIHHPRNFIGLPNPTPGNFLPEFLQSQNCSLLTDIRRIVLAADYVAPDDDFDRNTLSTHFDSLVATSFLLAEAGALTLPHTDFFGYGTWITCLEGEIGYAWLNHPTEAQLEAWRKDEDGLLGRGDWLFKVLRPGDSTYTNPGTVHYVFRLPNGKQTLAAAGHLLRRSDVCQWLKVLHQELKDSIDDPRAPDYVAVVLHLLHAVDSVLPFINTDLDMVAIRNAERLAGRFGGIANVIEASRLIHDIQNTLVEVDKAARSRESHNDPTGHDHGSRRKSGSSGHDAGVDDDDDDDDGGGSDDAPKPARTSLGNAVKPPPASVKERSSSNSKSGPFKTPSNKRPSAPAEFEVGFTNPFQADKHVHPAFSIDGNGVVLNPERTVIRFDDNASHKRTRKSKVLVHAASEDGEPSDSEPGNTPKRPSFGDRRSHIDNVQEEFDDEDSAVEPSTATLNASSLGRDVADGVADDEDTGVDDDDANDADDDFSPVKLGRNGRIPDAAACQSASATAVSQRAENVVDEKDSDSDGRESSGELKQRPTALINNQQPSTSGKDSAIGAQAAKSKKGIAVRKPPTKVKPTY